MTFRRRIERAEDAARVALCPRCGGNLAPSAASISVAALTEKLVRLREIGGLPDETSTPIDELQRRVRRHEAEAERYRKIIETQSSMQHSVAGTTYPLPTR